ncbi:2425_t:CDS:1, partial [Dentiscutata erythropus]
MDFVSNLDIVNAPQLLKPLIAKCWDDNPLFRPEAHELFPLFRKWYYRYDPNSELNQQYQQTNVAGESLTLSNLTYKTHPQDIYISQMHDLNLISEKFNVEDN